VVQELVARLRQLRVDDARLRVLHQKLQSQP
jgi:hypothetical protein